MKKISALLLSLIFTASMTACGVSGQSGTSNPASGNGEQNSQAAVSGDITGEITVSCYDTMTYKNFLDTAAALFMEKYPGTSVIVETFSAMPEIKTAESGGNKMATIEMKDDPQSRTDYINKINTSLMSGEGADLLAMDVLPFHKYAESAQLENLADYMTQDPEFSRSDYRGNILDAIQYKDGTWFLPLDYSFNYYAYDSTLLDGDTNSFGADNAYTAQKLMEIAVPNFDSTAKMFNVPGYIQGPDGGLFGRLLSENYASFVDVENKAAHFDDGAFTALLESIRTYEEQGYVSQGITGQMEAGDVMRGQAAEPTARYFFKPKSNFTLAEQFNRGSGRKMRMVTSGVEPGIEDDDQIAGIIADQDGSVPFTFGQAYGINSNSSNKQTAWAFLKFLLSEEIQLSTSLSSITLPLHNAARDAKAELILSGAFMTGGGGIFIGGAPGGGQQAGGPGGAQAGAPGNAPAGGGQQAGVPGLDKVQQDVLDNYKNAVEKLSDQINSFTVEDSVINDMITAEVRYFFSGEKSAEEVAKNLQSKVDLYLNE